MKGIIKKGKNEGQVITTLNGFVCLFPRNFTAEIGSEIQFMITGVNPQGTALFVAPVTEEHVLIDHKGFECSGSMCCTTARSPQIHGILTPGNTGVYEADNVNCKFGYLDPVYIIYPKKPGKVWVLKSDVAKSAITRKVRAVGLEDPKELAIYVNKYDAEHLAIAALRKARRG